MVIGANGKTGKRCVKYAAENGWDVIAATRDGNFPSLSEIKEDARGRVTTKQCSVTSSMAEITNAIDGAESVTAGTLALDAVRDGILVSVSASEVRWKHRHHGAGASSENQDQEWDRCSNNHEAGSR